MFRLGRLMPQAKGPGLFLMIPVIDRMVMVDLRTVTLNIPPQDVITKDNVPVGSRLSTASRVRPVERRPVRAPHTFDVVHRIRFYFDVVCPYSYMESHVVEAAEDSGRVSVEWLPFELRPAPKPLLEVRGDHLRTDWTQHVYRRALDAGVEIHLPRYQPRSTLPLAACLWAGGEGRLRAFKHALYEAFFCEGLDIGTDGEISRAAGIAGLDPVAAVAAAYDHERLARLRAIRHEAEAAGVTGVPTLVTEDGRTHWGMGGVELLLADEPLVPRATEV